MGADVDCVDNALCCFDGCVNACFYGGDREMPGEDPPALATPAPAPPAEVVPPPAPVPDPQPAVPAPAPVTTAKPKPAPRAPAPVQRPKPRQPPLNNAIRQVVQQVVGGSSNNRVIQSYVGPLAESKPFIMCPSAMLCVPKANCDF